MNARWNSNVKKTTEQNKRMPGKKKPSTDLAIDLQVDEQYNLILALFF